MIRRSPAPMAARSAAMLIVLAMTRSVTITNSTRCGRRRAILRARPRRVSQPMQALMIWIAAMNGSASSIVQVSA